MKTIKTIMLVAIGVALAPAVGWLMLMAIMVCGTFLMALIEGK